MLRYSSIARITSTNLSTLPLRDALFTSTIIDFGFSGHQHHHFSSTPSLQPTQWSQLKSSGILLALLISYLIRGQISLMQRRLLRSGYSTVGNLGVLLLIITKLDFNFTVSFQPAPFLSELHRATTSLESLHILHTTALLRLIHGLNHATRHGILQALLNAMSISSTY
jgi:hypothetical protein